MRHGDVVGADSCMRGSDAPCELPGRDDLYDDDDWLARGNTTIVGPDGDTLAGPLTEAAGILYAKLDISLAHQARRRFDPVGHYARPDVFHLDVDASPRPPVTFRRAVRAGQVDHV